MKNSNKRQELQFIFTNGLLFRNPLLVAALGLFPVAACSTLQSAVPVALILAVQSLLSGLLLCGVGGFLPSWLRPGAAVAVSAVCWLPACLLADALFPGAVSALGLTAGLLISNSMALSRLNDYAPTHILPAVAADVLGCTLGFAAVLCAQAALREFLQTGAVWGGAVRPAPGVLGDSPALPFFGFLLLGFCAAAVQALNTRRAQHAGKRRVTRL